MRLTANLDRNTIEGVKNKIHLARIAWEKYLDDDERSEIRPILVEGDEDVERLLKMEENADIKRFIVGEQLEDKEDVVEFALAKFGYTALAISGKASHVEPVEVGRLQGWVTVYDDHPKRIKRLNELVGEADRYLEIGFARYPEAKSGQVASAIRQVVRAIKEEHKKKDQRVVITAYANTENEASVRVLKAAGFENKGTVKYTTKSKDRDSLFVI